MLTTKDPTKGTTGAASARRSGRAGESAHVVARTDRDVRTRQHRIGRIVAGSLLAGLVAALALVLGPVGGAPEHVIDGTALLPFAAGWGLLAALSARWTDQPQRWATAPAGLMTLAGSGLLLFAPDGRTLDALGWVWPVALLALVGWMVV